MYTIPKMNLRILLLLSNPVFCSYTTSKAIWELTWLVPKLRPPSAASPQSSYLLWSVLFRHLRSLLRHPRLLSTLTSGIHHALIRLPILTVLAATNIPVHSLVFVSALFIQEFGFNLELYLMDRPRDYYPIPI